jgi:hypothetical protein
MVRITGLLGFVIFDYSEENNYSDRRSIPFSVEGVTYTFSGPLEQ